MPKQEHTSAQIAMPLSRQLIAMVLVCSVTACLTANLHANPTTADPDTALKAHNTINGAEKQIQAMYAKFAEWEQLVITSTEAANAGRRFPHSQLARIYPETYRGIWYAQHLQAMGEPAGYDLERKFTELRKAMGVFSPKLQEFYAKELAALRKNTPKRQKTLAEISKLVSEGKLVEAERQMQKIYLEELTSIFYLPYSQSKVFENELSGKYREFSNELSRQRREQYREQAHAKIASFAEAVETLQAESQRIAKELASSPTVTLSAGQTGDAADAIGYLHTLWGNASAAISRSVAVAWAFEGGDLESTAQPFSVAVKQTESIASQAIVEVLNAAAKSTPADQVASLLPRILSELSIIDRRRLGRFDDSVTAAVDQLIAKNAALAGQAERYVNATLEPSRWMTRFTAQQVEQQLKEYPTASNLMNRELTAEASVQPAIYGPTPAQKRVLTPGALSRPASWLVADAKPVIGMKVSEAATLRLTAASNLAVVRQDPRHYANLAADFPIDAYVAEMNESLLLDAAHGPLDLSSADAKSAAERQEFASVGGQITGLALESFLARFATLPDAAHALVPLNSLPVIDKQGAPYDRLIWRLNLQPEWVAHRLFFAKSP